MTTTIADFEGIEGVVADDLRFRLKLGIGEDAYRSIRYAKLLQQFWDVGGVAAAGANFAAKSAMVTSLFGGSGLLATLGLSTAVTPVGWVIAAGVASAGAYYGVMRLAGAYGGARVSKIPEFINSPIDYLGAVLFDTIGTLAVKLATLDGNLHDGERAAILDYFVNEWGFDPQYCDRALSVIIENNSKISLKDAAKVLGGFVREHEDCSADVMREDIITLLREIPSADGRVDEVEELALEKIEAILRDEMSLSITRSAGKLTDSIWRAAQSAGNSISDLANTSAVGISETAKSGFAAFKKMTGKE